MDSFRRAHDLHPLPDANSDVGALPVGRCNEKQEHPDDTDPTVATGRAIGADPLSLVAWSWSLISPEPLALTMEQSDLTRDWRRHPKA